MKKNELKYRVTQIGVKTRFIVEISLDDDCHNGHNDFSITATGYRKLQSGRWDFEFGGCCHEEILKRFPQFKCFVNLHLSDVNGAPMYAVANGFYYFKQGKKDATIAYLRITEAEYNRLAAEAGDEQYFAYLLQEMGVFGRWKYEAEQSIKYLEELTGDEFEDNSTKLRNYYIPAAEIAEIKKRRADGYYTPEAVLKRKEEELEAKKQATIQKLTDECNKAKAKLEQELQVKLFVLNSGLPLDNFIYYNHKNEGVFNWLDYREKVTQEAFVDFMQHVDYNCLPANIQFSIK